MGNNKTITFVDGYKEVCEVELICAFEIKKFGNKYIIYTKGEKDKDSHPIIYLGKVEIKDSKQFITNIDEAEGMFLKDLIKTMSKYSLEGEYNV